MKLFPHNQEAFESAVRMFKRENRVCIIQPTGTGKSVVIAEFVNQNSSKRHLLLAPGSHIFNEIQKHVKNVEITFSTYIGLKQKESFFVKNSFDYIYLDEFHRLGADVWGGTVKRLLSLNPRAKILGTSATPIRYLDDNRNMATEIFKDQIATRMSLISAISKGILPAPIYVSALYSIQDEYQQMKKKVMSSNSKDKERLLKDLDSKVIDWEKSSGLDTVMQKHLSRERRRVIVFCKDWEHLKYAQKLLGPIFKKIYGRVEVLSLYSKRKIVENETALKSFRSENESAIVLYTIDKVNEGLHSKSCNTVILLRDTTSANVFYQQIGRAFSIKPTNRPLVIDLVNNFKNIQLAPIRGDSENELNLLGNSNQASENEKRKERITFIDETQDIRQIFSAFENAVDVWKQFYEKAKAYFMEHGHPYVDCSDQVLHDWVQYQTKLYGSGHLGKVRTSQLRAIGMELDISARWMAAMFELTEWVKKNGRLPTFEENAKLYSWMVRQRQAFRGGTLVKAQVDTLRDLFSLEGDKRVEERVERLIEYYKNGSGLATDDTVKHDLSRIKVLYKGNKLSKATLNSLRSANVPIDESVNDLVWLSNVKDVLACYNEKGRLPKKGVKTLYGFCVRERSYLRKKHPYGKLIENNSDVKILFERFRKIIEASTKPDWNSRYAELKRVVKLHGRIFKPEIDKKLIGWVMRQRQALMNGRLSAEQKTKLLAIKEVNWYGKGTSKVKDS